MEKEQWKNEVMSSLQGIRRAEPNPFLFTQIEERIKSPARLSSDSIIAFPKLSLVFAGIALLLVLNIVILKKSNNNSSSRTYSLSNVNYQLY